MCNNNIHTGVPGTFGQGAMPGSYLINKVRERGCGWDTKDGWMGDGGRGIGAACSTCSGDYA